MLPRLLRLAVLFIGLCLGLTGQGHDLVLCVCQNAHCVAMETENDEFAAKACDCHCDCPEQERGKQKQCQDISLGHNVYVATGCMVLPHLGLLPVGELAFAPFALQVPAQTTRMARSSRGPPGEPSSPPQILEALRSVVLIV